MRNIGIGYCNAAAAAAERQQNVGRSVLSFEEGLNPN